MLTKEQIETYWDWHECNCKFAFDSPTSFEVCKQARQAIDLAAENERLKAKLDAVRAECKQSLQSSRGLSAKLSVLRLLAILDKDGE